MMKKILAVILTVMLISVSGNCVYAKKIRKMSQLELREMETHFFETSDTDRVMKSAVNTLQDSGFIVQEIEPELGYIRARKIFKHRHVRKMRVFGCSMWLAAAAAYTVFSYGAGAYAVYPPTMQITNELRDKTIVVDSNVNVEKFGKNKTKVRFVLVEKILLNADGFSYVKAAPIRVIRLYSPEVYREFFAQLDKSIFYEGI